MKKILLLLSIVFLASCSQSEQEEQEQIKANQDYFQDVIDKAHVVERDGCEYLVSWGYDRGFMAHKGDCKNMIHK
jgi:hypothetical protein